jgi:hypothetical protein
MSETELTKITIDTALDWQLCEFCGCDIGPEDPVNFVHLQIHYVTDSSPTQAHFPFHPGACWLNRSMTA